VLQPLLDLLVAPACLTCRAPLRAGERLCRACRTGLVWLPADRCPRCGLPNPCGTRCPARAAAFSQSWSPVVFDGTARALVHALKLRGMIAAADVMAAQIAATVPPTIVGDGALVPVPGHPRRRRARGFDQAERIAAALGHRAALPVVRCLTRGGAAPPQAGAGRGQRLHRIAGAIAVGGAAPERAILVDDVHTTGATLDACARALRAAGTTSAVAVTYARTLG
jgi:predicted amidophosphoribosyltransferase